MTDRTLGNRVLHVLAPLAIALVIVGIAYAVLLFHAASLTAAESAQRGLLAEAAQLLDKYHEAHGTYPESLDALPLTFPDGGDRGTLALLKYQTDGERYAIVTRGVWTGTEFKECR